jgi:RNA polymerase sigma factor (sigma-70 family)
VLFDICWLNVRASQEEDGCEIRMRSVPLMDDATEARTDAALLAGGESGERELFGVLFDRHSRAVYATAFALVHNPADAEALLSDAFLLLWRKRASIEFFGDSLLPWLITTVRYLARNRNRSSRFSTVQLNDEIDAGRSPSAESTAEAWELSRQLDALICTLDPLDQRIVQLCLVDRLSYEQAASQLGIAHGAVRNRLSRSKKQLRDTFEPEGQNQ